MRNTSRSMSIAMACILVAAPMAMVATEAHAGTDPFIAEITMFGGNFAPRGWALCHGQTLAIASNQALFSLLGTTYGGDGRTTFMLPDLRGRSPIGAGSGPGLSSYDLGQMGGAETVTLTVLAMPTHTHMATAVTRASDQAGDVSDAADAVPAKGAEGTSPYTKTAPNVSMHAGMVTVENGHTGGGQAHENRPPYLAINFIIALQGTFPSRN